MISKTENKNDAFKYGCKSGIINKLNSMIRRSNILTAINYLCSARFTSFANQLKGTDKLNPDNAMLTMLNPELLLQPGGLQ